MCSQRDLRYVCTLKVLKQLAAVAHADTTTAPLGAKQMLFQSDHPPAHRTPPASMDNSLASLGQLCYTHASAVVARFFSLKSVVAAERALSDGDDDKLLFA